MSNIFIIFMNNIDMKSGLPFKSMNFKLIPFKASHAC